MNQAKEAIIIVVDQIDYILSQIETEDYRRQLPEFDGHSIGQHFRHILEFFQCLGNGMGEGVIDYASRERNMLYEDSPSITASAFRDFIQALEKQDIDSAMKVKAEYGCDERPDYHSSLSRELLFVYDHAIHHLAIIRIGLTCHFSYVNMHRDLGVSPSTIKSRLMSS
ncbi:MAG: hypothetical protein R3A50_07940 [Saprospiraceae bacterium]